MNGGKLTMGIAAKRITCIALAMIATIAAKSQMNDAQSPRATGKGFLVEVNGTRLLQSDVDREFCQSIRNFPEDAKRRFMEGVYKERIEAFVTSVLLVGEAKARGLTITEEDAIQAYRKHYPRVTFADVDASIQRYKAKGMDFMKFIMEQALIEKLKAVLTESLVFSPEEIAAYRTIVPETVHVRQIFTKLPPDAETKSKAQQKAADIRKQLVEGADFAEMAKLYSDSPEKVRGGDMEPFRRGRCEKPFDDAAFAQKEKEIGPVVKTSYGYHIIQVLEHKSGNTLTREDVLLALKSKRAEVIAEEVLKKLRQKAIIRYPK